MTGSAMCISNCMPCDLEMHDGSVACMHGECARASFSILQLLSNFDLFLTHHFSLVHSTNRAINLQIHSR